MKNSRPLLLIMLASVGLGILTVFLFAEFAFTQGESYGVLTVAPGLSDRIIGEQLRAAGFQTYFSESSVKVYFDDFGRWKEFYLDDYRNHIEPFDPRDDGYAEKLRSFFVNGEKRSFFVLLEKAVTQGRVKKNIALALGSTPFSFEILPSQKPVLFWIILQSAAAAFVLAVSKERRRLVPALPVIFAFSCIGLPGIVLSGILAAILELLREPARELFSGRPYGDFSERFRPYRRILRWSAACVFLYGIAAALMKVPAVPALAGFFAFAAAIFLTFYEPGKTGRRLFIPVVILPFRQKTPAFHQPMLAFISAALMGSLVAVLLPGLATAPPGPSFVAPPLNEYREHMAFQASFSYTPLGSAGREYRHYLLGADGLITGAEISSAKTNVDFPPFPLEKLTAFLLNYEITKAGESSRLFIKEWFAMALMVLLLVPSRLGTVKKSGKKDSVFLVRMRTAA